MPKKRPPIKGQGLNAFLASDDPEVPERAKEDKRTMVTVYLPDELVERLEQMYLQRRMKNRKVQKSQIVAEALEHYLNVGET